MLRHFEELKRTAEFVIIISLLIIMTVRIAHFILLLLEYGFGHLG